MAGKTDVFDLGRLQLTSGQGRRVDLLIELEGLEFGGQRYSHAPGLTEATLDASRTRSGYSLRLRFGARLEGPCMRCLEGSATALEIDAREVDQAGGDDEMSSPYVDANELDVRSWARDALALALPDQILCRADCAGLCPACGADLNVDPHEHAEDESDPRWAALAELRDRL